MAMTRQEIVLMGVILGALLLGAGVRHYRHQVLRDSLQARVQDAGKAWAGRAEREAAAGGRKAAQPAEISKPN